MQGYMISIQNYTLINPTLQKYKKNVIKTICRLVKINWWFDVINKIHSVAKVYTVLPVTTVNCLYSGGRE